MHRPATTGNSSQREWPQAGPRSLRLYRSWKPVDLNVIDTFFSRALDLDLEKRAEIAGWIAGRVSAKRGSPGRRGGAGACAGVDCSFDAGSVGR
jgi:hypothetical protein